MPLFLPLSAFLGLNLLFGSVLVFRDCVCWEQPWGEALGARGAGPRAGAPGPFGLFGKLMAVQILGGRTAQESDLASGGFGGHPHPHP